MKPEIPESCPLCGTPGSVSLGPKTERSYVFRCNACYEDWVEPSYDEDEDDQY